MVASLMSALPGSVAQGLIWGILAIGVYITYKVLDFADLTVDGSLATGGAVAVMCMLNGANTYVALILAFLAGMLAGLVTGLFHTALGIPPILAGILTQLGLYSINMRIMGKANQAISVMQYDVLVSLRYIPHACLLTTGFCIVIIALLYWFFGTEIGASVIKNSIILNDVYIGDNTHIENCIVESRGTLNANTYYCGDNGVKVVVEHNERYVF